MQQRHPPGLAIQARCLTLKVVPTLSTQRRFLIVDDDLELAALLTEYLAGAGIVATTSSDGARGLAQAIDGNFDLIILDVMLPVLDGFKVLRQLRMRSNVPVIMLTARREREDRIEGLQTGADDYLPKPFDPDELLARANAILRRVSQAAARIPEVTLPGGLSLDVTNRQVTLSGHTLDLTSIEFAILDLLARPLGRVVPREEISGALYQRPAQAYDRSIDVHISRLRRKIEPAQLHIRSVRGSGYALGAAHEESS